MPNPTVIRYKRKSDRGTAKQRERIIQRAITRYLRHNYPEVDFYNDWSSDAYLSAGQNKARMDLASMNGWVDLFIPEPSRGYHGLFIELKKEGVRPYKKDGSVCADKQIRKEHEFLLRQHKKGYCARFACGYEKAIELIDWYFENEKPVNLEIF